MSMFDVWFWLKLDAIREAAGFLFFLFGIFGLIGLVATISCMCELGIKMRWPVVLASLIVLFGWTCGLANVLLPTTKQAAIIYAAPLVASSSVITNDVPEIYALGIDAIKEKLSQYGDAK